jgi:hypothetical protein
MCGANNFRDLLAGCQPVGNIAISEAFPHRDRHLYFFES